MKHFIIQKWQYGTGYYQWTVIQMVDKTMCHSEVWAHSFTLLQASRVIGTVINSLNLHLLVGMIKYSTESLRESKEYNHAFNTFWYIIHVQ